MALSVLLSQSEYDKLRERVAGLEADLAEARGDARAIWQSLSGIVLAEKRDSPLMSTYYVNAAHLLLRINSHYLRGLDIGILDQIRRDYGLPDGFIGFPTTFYGGNKQR